MEGTMEKTNKMLAFLHPIIEEADPELEDFLIRYVLINHQTLLILTSLYLSPVSMNHGGVLLVLLTSSHLWPLGRKLGPLTRLSHPIKEKLCTLGDFFPVFFSSQPDLR